MPIAKCNGIHLYYEVEGNGTPLLLIQGLGGDGASWSLQREALAPRFQVITFDNRGVGRSSKPPGPYTTELMAEDTWALLDHLGIERAFLMGCSMGGMIAQEMALSRPDRVAALNLIATYGEVDPYCARWFEVQRHLAEHGSKEFRIRQSSLWLFHPHSFAALPEQIADTEQALMENDQPLDAYLGQWHACMHHSTTARLGQLRMPVLICVGRDDIITHVEMSRRLHAAIPRSRLVELEECGHGLLWEKPEDINRHALDFFLSVSEPVDAVKTA
jgi:pimeloyl-ACP methyl ester carboxylesterase